MSANGLTGADLRSEIGANGAALVLDFVGADDTLALAAAAVGTGGGVVYAGRGGGTYAVRAFVTPFDSSVTVSTWGTIPELAEVVALARSGAIRTETTLYPLDRTHQRV